MGQTGHQQLPIGHDEWKERLMDYTDLDAALREIVGEAQVRADEPLAEKKACQTCIYTRNFITAIKTQV